MSNRRRFFPIKLIAAMLIAAIAVVALANWLLHTAEARRSGNLNLSGLHDSVSVFYDAWGVPHIDAGNDEDAYRALGYLHAQDRLFQMDMLRRVGGGRLSELLGQEAFTTDRFFRSLGISRFAREHAERLETQADTPHVRLIKAYQDGINQYIDSGARPIEYRLLLSEPDYFSLVDIAHIMGYMAYSFAEAFKTDALVDHVRGTLGVRHMQDLVPGIPDRPPVRDGRQTQAPSDLLPVLEQVAKVEQFLPVGQFLGSNAWVVNASRSQQGAPMLANDPHIGFAVPAVWYEAHIRTPEHEVYGHFLAGLPFAMLGQTRRHAWGLTMLMNDEIDFYRERVNPDNPNQVWIKDRWQNLQIHEEVIKVRGQEDRLVRMRSSSHGPIINDLPGSLQGSLEQRPVSLFWTFLDPQSDSAEAFYGLSRANNMVEFEAAAALHWSPGLNLIYADVDDNIAMWAAGRLKRWPSSNNSFALLSGSSSRDEFLGYQAFAANPRIINPREGHIFSTNNPYPAPSIRRQLPGYYAPSERAQRLASLLESNQSFDLSQFKAMQLDNHRPQALDMLQDALPLFNHQLLPTNLHPAAERAAELLGEWDGNFQRDSVGATLFQRWHDNLMEALFADELGPHFAFFRNTFMARKSLASLYWKPASPWWDNRQQPIMDGRQAAIEQAWVRTVETLSEQFGDDPQDWNWGRLAQLQHQHPLAERLPLLSRLNSTPVAVDGSIGSLNNMTFDSGQALYDIKAGPSTRRLIDLADLNSSLGINPLGQSGNPFDPHFDNQAELYNEGRYRTQLFDWQSIQALPDQLTLSPKRRR